MGWTKPDSNGMGGYRSERNDRGQHESLHGQTVKGGRISGDHVHFHKDGATVTKGGKKYTIKRSNKSWKIKVVLIRTTFFRNNFNLKTMLENILKIWNVELSWKVRNYIENIYFEHKEAVGILNKNWYDLKEVFLEEILRLGGIRFKASNQHQFDEISSISWTEILVWLKFSDWDTETELILSSKEHSGTL